MQRIIEKAAVLTEALPYIQDFKGSLVLVKVGGSVMEVPENLESLLIDIAFMSAVGMKTVLVHGGGKAISRGMDRAGIKTDFVMGLRVTTGAAIRVVERVLKREVNANVVALLQKHKARARPLHGDWIFKVEKRTGKNPETGAAIDWGYVGEPADVDVLPVLEMTGAGIIPVVTPLGSGTEGDIYNINADTAAAALAKALKVRKLAFISDVPGLLMDVNDPASLLKTLTVGSVGRLKESGVVGGGMLPKLDSCVEAIKAGVGKVHLVDGRMPHSLLLEIFTKQGVGTEIISDE
ncbi:MAG: acetylglutamate kinase [Kiritimatiellae bacterium]|nr:acetylglutamate kinase [Kiritimatiellia bacterium]MDD3545368.1 acetylglutamate kinase [Kiritimatiellia bacterium]MDD4025447.1 acetylglutamate kinase [Kiritimatiellia bacterium]